MLHLPTLLHYVENCLACAVIILCVSSAQAAEPERRLLVLGDSLSAAYGMDVSQGWVALLAQRLDDTISVINASVSGNTTADGLARLPALLKQYTPNVVVIELGGNDGLRGHPVSVIRANLQRMIALGQAINAKVVILGIEIPPNYGRRYTEQFRQVFVDVSGLHDVSLVPFFLAGVAAALAMGLGTGLTVAALTTASLWLNQATVSVVGGQQRLVGRWLLLVVQGLASVALLTLGILLFGAALNA